MLLVLLGAGLAMSTFLACRSGARIVGARRRLAAGPERGPTRSHLRSTLLDWARLSVFGTAASAVVGAMTAGVLGAVAAGLGAMVFSVTLTLPAVLAAYASMMGLARGAALIEQRLLLPGRVAERSTGQLSLSAVAEGALAAAPDPTRIDAARGRPLD